MECRWIIGYVNVHINLQRLILIFSFNRVSTDTLRGQLVYELQGNFYYNPDVIADLSGIDMEQLSQDKVRISGVKGKSIPRYLRPSLLASLSWLMLASPQDSQRRKH